jgi:1-acyl-sn-glycerol-3-phosphate acyltransferase
MSAAAPVSFVAKADVNRWPFFGSLARLQRTVFVDRERRVTTAGSRDEMAERLKAGDLLVLFAEGTSGDGARVLPFKSAFFGAAETEGIPVHPVTLAYTHHRNMPMTRRQRPSYAWYGDMDLPPHLWEALAMGPVTVTLRFHPPETTHAHGGRKQLARHAETRVRAGLVDLLHGPGKMG